MEEQEYVLKNMYGIAIAYTVYAFNDFLLS